MLQRIINHKLAVPGRHPARVIPGSLTKVLSDCWKMRLRLFWWLTFATSFSGVVLFVPQTGIFWSIHINALLVHLMLGIGVLIPLLTVPVRHGKAHYERLLTPSGFSGILLALNVGLASITGVLMSLTSAVFWPWVLSLHRWAGIAAVVSLLLHFRHKQQSEAKESIS